jgi:hypothetical protein
MKAFVESIKKAEAQALKKMMNLVLEGREDSGNQTPGVRWMIKMDVSAVSRSLKFKMRIVQSRARPMICTPRLPKRGTGEGREK